MLAPELIHRFSGLVDAAGALTADDARAPYLKEWRGRYRGSAPLVLRPRETAEVAAILALAQATRTPIVPQSGNTGLCGGAVASEDTVLLSLDRMDRIRAVDHIGNTLIAEAGVILAEAQAAATRVDRLFPLSLASEGSARLGGLISTNAGGVQVLRYGSMRRLVLGLEVALADGRVWEGLSGLRKDNRGYDLKQLFIGAEGTLGIVTAAALALVPRPRACTTAWVAVDAPEHAMALFQRVQAASGETLTSFELIARFARDLVLRHIAGVSDPLGAPAPWYVLVELASGEDEPVLMDRLARLLSDAVAAGEATDAAIARSEAQRAALWRLRETVPEAQSREGASLKHDVSVPLAAIPALLEETRAAIGAVLPDARPCPFGHVGDGNIHLNVQAPTGMDAASFRAFEDEISGAVLEIIDRLGGSFSAEHGIGRLKTTTLAHTASPVTLDLMRAVKQALDPNGILNPGVILA